MSSLAPSRIRFTVDEYYRMAEVGILQPTDRVELLDGEVFHMSPIGSRHAACVDRLLAAFSAGLASKSADDRPIVRCQSPVRLSQKSEPEPDLTLLRARADFYAEAHPGPSDILLVVEVADSSLGFDRAVKLPLYARAGIPEVWIVEVVERRIEVYREPAEHAFGNQPFGRRQRFGSGQTIDVAAVPGLELQVDQLLA